nr:toll-like receptor 4 [Lytechinus pictus]
MVVSITIHCSYGYGRDSLKISSIPMKGSLQGCNENLQTKTVACIGKGLKRVPRNLPEDIFVLNLAYNNITILLNASFEEYPLIKDLYIYFNDLRSIEPAAFHPIRDLRYLDLSNNMRLVVLPVEGVFMKSPKLFTLNLSRLNLRSIPNDTLKWSPRLRLVNLSSNKLSFINLSSCGMVEEVNLSRNLIQRLTMEYFIFPCRTDHLDLTNNPIQFVDPDDIASLQVRSLKLGQYNLRNETLLNIILGISKSNIQELTISNGFVGEFPEGLFEPLRNSSLSVLKFNGNNIFSHDLSVFSNLTKIVQFGFSYNIPFIDKIQPVVFDGMRALKVLTIDGNEITELNPFNQNWTVNLTHLSLKDNKLRAIFAPAFSGLESLISLDMAWNKYLFVFMATSGLDNIQYIDLRGSSITFLHFNTPTLRFLFLNSVLDHPHLSPGVSFKHLQSLVELNMRDSRVYDSNLWGGVDESLFDGLLNLTYLDLSRNDFRYDLTPGIFRELYGLIELNLEECFMTGIHHLLFVGLESLQKVSLKGNNIKHLRGDLLSVLGQIIDINLEGNLIDFLDDVMFLNNKKLTNLSLANNKLTRLNQSTFKPIFSSISTIDISMNPIVCNCDLKWLIDWLKGSIELNHMNNTVCSPASLKPLRLKTLFHFHADELCSIRTCLVSMIPLAAVGVLVLVVIVFNNRWHLKYKIFLLKLAIFGYKEMQDARDHNDYEFDMNIMFYDDDEEWIREHLRPALEENLPQFQRNVFGDEGLVLGMHYLNAVDHVVTHSYKTIIVLSRAAVRDHWFILKFRTAMDHVSDTLIEFVLVIFLEDIPDDEVPFLVRLYLSDGRPYINWTDDVRGHEYFWNELSKRLTINLRTNDNIPNE